MRSVKIYAKEIPPEGNHKRHTSHSITWYSWGTPCSDMAGGYPIPGRGYPILGTIFPPARSGWVMPQDRYPPTIQDGVPPGQTRMGTPSQDGGYSKTGYLPCPNLGPVTGVPHPPGKDQ